MHYVNIYEIWRIIFVIIQKRLFIDLNCDIRLDFAKHVRCTTWGELLMGLPFGKS